MKWLRSILAWVLSALAGCLKGRMSAITIVPSVTSDVGAVAGAVTQVAKVVEQIQGEKNTPAEVKAKISKEVQAELDRVNKAVDAGNLDAVRKAVSIGILLCALVGCTIAPKPVLPSVPSAVGLGVAGVTNGVWTVGADTAAEYRALIPAYGHLCAPPITSPEGLATNADGSYSMTPTAMKALGYMQFYRRNPALVP